MTSILEVAFVSRAGLFGPTVEQIARLCELAWWDGARTGLVAGGALGVVIGIVVATLLRARA